MAGTTAKHRKRTTTNRAPTELPPPPRTCAECVARSSVWQLGICLSTCLTDLASCQAELADCAAIDAAADTRVLDAGVTDGRLGVVRQQRQTDSAAGSPPDPEFGELANMCHACIGSGQVWQSQTCTNAVTQAPFSEPTMVPTVCPTNVPSPSPSQSPTVPTGSPSMVPTPAPTGLPTTPMPTTAQPTSRGFARHAFNTNCMVPTPKFVVFLNMLSPSRRSPPRSL